jgi:hypothetical protein
LRRRLIAPFLYLQGNIVKPIKLSNHSSIANIIPQTTI